MRILPIVILFLLVILLIRFSSNIIEIKTIVMRFYNAKAVAMEGEKSADKENKSIDKNEKSGHSNGEVNTENPQNIQGTQTESKDDTAKAEAKKTQDNNAGFEPPSNLTEGEIVLLKNLRNKRIALENKETEMKTDSITMQTLQEGIVIKLQNLEEKQKKLQETLNSYNEKRNENIKGLVKIYENMKPKDAASIFDNLHISVLLDLASQMQEVKLAPIIALMSPAQAQNLTVALANRKKLE